MKLRENHNKINFQRKIIAVILLVAVILFLLIFVFFMIQPRITFFSIKNSEEANTYEGELTIPDISSGEEIINEGYKYSNNSGIIVSTEPYIHCSWKPDLIDDGWKNCEAIFEIENQNNIEIDFNSLDIKLDFGNDNIKNLRVSYSDEYDIRKESYKKYNIKKIQKKVTVKDSTVRKEKPVRIGKEDINFGIKSSAEVTEAKEEDKILSKSIINHDTLNYKKRNFKNFISFGELKNLSIAEKVNISEEDNKNLSIAEKVNISEGDNKNLSDDKYNKSPEISENISEDNFSKKDNKDSYDLENKTEKEEKDNENISENGINKDTEPISVEFDLSNSEELIENRESKDDNSGIITEGAGRLSGFIIKSFSSSDEDNPKKSKDSFRIQKNFAIKVDFEMPKYSSNEFNFSISDINLDAKIDPYVSECAALNADNSIYTLEEDVSSTEICMRIPSRNVTLDCQGHSITYSSSGDGGYGIYSDSPVVNIKNCVIIEGSSSNPYSAGIYLELTGGINLTNNSFFTYSSSSYGIYFDGVTGSFVSDSFFNLSGSDNTGVFLDSSEGSSEGNSIFNNILMVSGNQSEGIYFDCFSNYGVLHGNNISIFNDEDIGIFLDTSTSTNISFNNIYSYSSGTYPLLFSENYNLSVIYNQINNFGSDSKSIFLDSSTFSTLNNNIVNVFGDYSDGILLSAKSTGNFIQNNKINISSSSSSYGLNIESLSEYNNFANNSIFTNGDSCHGVYSSNSNYNNFIGEDIRTFGYGSYCYYFSKNSSNNFVLNNTLLDSGEYGMGIYIDQGSNNNFIKGNNIESFGNDGYGVFLDYYTGHNRLLNNNISVHGPRGYGVLIYQSNNNSFIGDDIFNFGENSAGFLFDHSSDSNLISNEYVSSRNISSYPIYVYFGNLNFSFFNTILDSNYPGLRDIFIDDSVKGGNWNFTNTSIENKSWGINAFGILNSRNYLDIHLNLDGLNATGADTNVYDKYNSLAFSGVSDDYGNLDSFLLLDYTQNCSEDSCKTYYSPYNINIAIDGEIYEFLVDLNESRFVEINITSPETLDNIISPEILSSGGGGGGGGNISCVPIADCSSWSDCANGKQTRTCKNLNKNCLNNLEIERNCSKDKNDSKKSKNILFDINLKVITKKINLFEKLMATVSLINVGLPGKVYANLSYKILDSRGFMVLEDKEIVLVETQIEFIKNFNISLLNEGKYKLSVDLSYMNQTEPAHSEDEFYIIGEQTIKTAINAILIFLILSTLLFLLLVVLNFLRNRKITQSPKEIKNKTTGIK